MFFAIILPFAQAFSMKIDEDLPGAITKYTLEVQLSITEYNYILMIFPLSFEFSEVNTIYCWFNGLQYQVESKNNEVKIFGDFIPSNLLNITLQNIENGYHPHNNDNNFILEFYLDSNLVEKQTCQYTLSYQQQLSFNGRYENYSTFVKTTLHFDINFLFRVRSGTTIDIIFPIINSGAKILMSILTQDSIPLYLNSTLDFQINLNQRKLTIYNLFQEQQLPGDSIQLQITNVYTNNQQLDGDQFFILYQTQYKGFVIAEGKYFFSDIKSVSQSKEFIIESTNQIVSQKTSLLISFLPRLAYRQGSQIYIHFLNLQSQQQINQTAFLPIRNINPSYQIKIENEGIVVKNFNPSYESMKFEFQLQEILNPTGFSTLDIGFYILTPEKDLIEYQVQQIQIIPDIIQQVKIEALNTTIFATTKIIIQFELTNCQTKTTTLKLKIPQQIEIIRDSIMINPDQSQDIQILEQEIQFKNYFSNNQFINQIEITLLGKIIGFVGETENFLIFTSDFQDALISTLRKPVFLTIKPSHYNLISFSPQIQVTDYLTNYLIKFQIPQIYDQSVMVLELPNYFQQQLSFCSASIEKIQIVCQILNYNLTLNLFIGGDLDIIIYNIRTERSVQEYKYQILGEIRQDSKIQSVQQNQQVSYSLLFSQTFYNYSLNTSNLFYGELTILQFQFNLLSTIHQTDILEITFPNNIENIISCSKFIERQIRNQIYLSGLQNGINYLQCELINPKEDIPMYPFYFNIFTNKGDIVAQFQDIYGIRDGMRSKNIDFQIQQSQFYLNEESNLNVIFFTNLGIQKNGLVKITFKNSPIILKNFKCQFQLNGTEQATQEVFLCESFQENENLVITSKFQNSLPPNTYQINFNGLILQGNVGEHKTNITMQNINEFGKIIEESLKQEKLKLVCEENCNNCDKKYNQCIQCKNGFVLYQNTCISKCSGNKVPSSQGCESCLTNPNCLLCDSQILNQCVQCIDEYILKNGYCLRIKNLIDSSSNHSQNQSNNNQSNSDSTDDSHTDFDQRKNQIYDGAPIYLITMGGMFMASMLNKLVQRKDSLIIKPFFILISLIDIPISIIRFIRFTLLQFPGYFLLSLSCLAVSFFVQIINSSQLELLMKTNVSLQKIVSTNKIKKQLATLFQWRIFLSILSQQCQVKILNEINKMFYIQNISQILPVIIQISFMLNQNQFFIFSLDDILYNSLTLILSLFKDVWITKKIHRQCQIHPELRDQSLQIQDQIFRVENEINQEEIIYYTNQPKMDISVNGQQIQ